MGEQVASGPVIVNRRLLPFPEPLVRVLDWNAAGDETVQQALELLNNGDKDLLRSAHVFASLAHDIGAASKFTLSHVVRASGCRRCTLFILENDVTLTLAAYTGVPQHVAVEIERIRGDRGVIGWVFNHGTPLLVHDVRRICLPGTNPTRYSSRSFVSVPVRTVNGSVIGVINATDPVDAETLRPDRLVSIAAAAAETAPILAQAWRSYELLRLSYLDPLTGLFNRRFLEIALQHYISAALRERFPVSLLIIDVDHFKTFNDRFGHKVGDDVLRLIADLLRQQFRAEDVLCRLGGEEFAVIMPRRRRRGDVDAPAAQEKEAVVFAERLRRAVESCQLDAILGKPAQVTVSCGIATYPQDARDGQHLLVRADEALYRAKRAGRNRVEVYCPVCGMSPAQAPSNGAVLPFK